MKAIAWIFFLLSNVFFINGPAFALSPQAKVSLITISRGNDLYSSFGHSVFWIYDPAENLDRAYNYGTFDFNPDFYMKFVRGKLDYRLSVSDLNYLIEDARFEQRSVICQELDLSLQQKEALLRFLEINYLPENRYYRYDFFYDNCSSRLRDVIKEVCRDSLQYNLSHDENLSFRQLIDKYLLDKEVQDLGMDIGLGAPADIKATPYQYMFLPDYLKAAFDSAKIYRSGQWVPLVSREFYMYDAKITRSEKGFQPVYLFWFFAALTVFVTIKNLKKQKKSFALDTVIFTILGVLGLVLVFLWFFTDHNVTVDNWNLLWATPLHLIAVVFLSLRKNFSFIYYYFAIYAAICLLLLLFWNWIPEEFNISVFPILVILIVRSMNIVYHFKNIAKNEP